MADKLTIEEFAAEIRKRDPRFADVSDADLVRGVLERKPEMLRFIQTSEPRPALNSLYERVGGRIKSNLDVPSQIRSLGDQVSAAIKDVKERGIAPEGGKRTFLDPLGGGKGPEFLDAIKSTYSKPENVLGDLISAHILNAGEGGPQPIKEGAKGILATTFQRLAGAGREPVLMESIAREVEMAKAQESYATKLAKVRKQEQLVASQHQQGESLHKNIQSTYEKVNKSLNARWDDMRSTPTTSRGKLAILKDSVGDAKQLKDGVELAEEKFLQGSPGSLRQFRDLVGWIERGKGEMVNPTWDEMRTHYSNMGDAMYGRPIPNNVYRALKYVREEVLGQQLKKLAVDAGAGGKYEALLRDHSQFEDDWKNTHSVTRAGGSPLAIARKSPNAATLVPQVTGRTGDLLIKQLSKYQDHGASPMTASAIRSVGTVNVPKPPTPPVEPPPIDPAEVRRNRILQYTSRPKGFSDFLPPRLFTEPLLSNRFIREFVAKYPRKEFPVPKSSKLSIKPAPEVPSAAAPFAEWGPAYQQSPTVLSSQGGGGANYTAEDLAALKQKWGIK